MSFTTNFAPFKPKTRLQGCEPILTLWSQLTYPLRNFNKHCCHVVIFCLLLLRKNVRNKPPPPPLNPVRLPLLGPWSKLYLSPVFLLSFFDKVGGGRCVQDAHAWGEICRKSPPTVSGQETNENESGSNSPRNAFYCFIPLESSVIQRAI